MIRKSGDRFSEKIIARARIWSRPMTEKRRVIVTQNDSAGKSSVLEDLQMEPYGVGVFNFWQTFLDRSPDDLSGRGPSFKFFPNPGATQFRLFTIPPEDPSATPDQIKAIADEF